jgi:hypothetical protein
MQQPLVGSIATHFLARNIGLAGAYGEGLHLVVADANDSLLGSLDKIAGHPQGILAGIDTKVFQLAQVFSLHAIDREVVKFGEVNHGNVNSEL